MLASACMQIALRANEVQVGDHGQISFMAGIRCDWDGRNIRLRGGKAEGVKSTVRSSGVS